ncbi:hypothetical protein FQN60_015347 [Etheostoma spectabile]|uniref:Uncharacterized protein n=1 Tax=Etheostoma spectabile TaxID=54343 RepID=A0A5J5CT19_9PERO|nr:hypothetical protein FQN60_015347 [Etheostoma spectabile]
MPVPLTTSPAQAPSPLSQSPLILQPLASPLQVGVPPMSLPIILNPALIEATSPVPLLPSPRATSPSDQTHSGAFDVQFRSSELAWRRSGDLGPRSQRGAHRPAGRDGNATDLSFFSSAAERQFFTVFSSWSSHFSEPHWGRSLLTGW